jgi:hypothetical protein
MGAPPAPAHALAVDDHAKRGVGHGSLSTLGDRGIMIAVALQALRLDRLAGDRVVHAERGNPARWREPVVLKQFIRAGGIGGPGDLGEW